jgi:hypothetical protein
MERPLSEQLTHAARDLVGLVLEDIPERLHHCARVAARAQALVATVPPSAADTLVASAWLHDIGYASRLQDSGFHPSTGSSTCAGKAGPVPSATWLRIIRVVASSRVFAGLTIGCASSSSSRMLYPTR